MHAEGTSSSTLDQVLQATNGALPNGAAHSSGRPEHPFALTPAQPQQQALCLLYGGFTGGGVEGTLLAVDEGEIRWPRYALVIAVSVICSSVSAASSASASCGS